MCSSPRIFEEKEIVRSLLGLRQWNVSELVPLLLSQASFLPESNCSFSLMVSTFFSSHKSHDGDVLGMNSYHINYVFVHGRYVATLTKEAVHKSTVLSMFKDNGNCAWCNDLLILPFECVESCSLVVSFRFFPSRPST